MPERDFQTNPVLNSPYKEPQEHWQLDENGLPSGEVVSGRRESKFLIPIPKAILERRRQEGEFDMLIGGQEQENSKINTLREELTEWRKKPLDQRGVSGVTQRLLQYWQEGKVSPRPFFCQIEAVETFIWLNEIAPKSNKDKVQKVLQEIEKANKEANMKLPRLAAKMATGAGKTTVMAMLIAYHSINKARAPRQKAYSDQFLIITPGITIKDRLRVLLPQDPDNYYEKSKIVPPDMLAEVNKAVVIITNYHTFKHREEIKLTKRTREILKGNNASDISTLETDGKMLHRVCPELLRRKDKVIVINDEAHHCYIHRKDEDAESEAKLEKEEEEEAERNDKAARLWINGIKALNEHTEIKTVYDLSATPFFLRGSGYQEGTLFQWVVSDFSLMEAIESGIVKLPRVPTKDVTKNQLPVYRDLYQHIKHKLPKHGLAKLKKLDPQDLPPELLGALQALYSHYETVCKSWRDVKIDIPPVFIIVCNNTSTSKLVYDYISGYKVAEGRWWSGQFPSFNNVTETGDGLRPRPSTLLIDSYQLESGEALSKEFKQAAAAEIALFKQEQRIRYPERDNSKISDEELLREVMNTVGKKQRLGENIRCVVSVSMLTEGWDARNVTHILGIRAFGTQLLCEQVVGRGLRRLSYDIEEGDEENGRLSPEYANVFGVPFNFAPGDERPPPPPQPPPVRVRHLDERAHLEIIYPRVRGYRRKPPEGKITAQFSKNSRLEINSAMAPPVTETQGIIGESALLTLDKLREHRINQVVFFLSAYVAKSYYKKENSNIIPTHFRDLVPIVRHWLQDYVTCKDNTCKQYLLWQQIADQAAECIYRACGPPKDKTENLLPLMDPFTPEGGTSYVDFLTRKKCWHETAPDKSHINLAICDSSWEMKFCQLLENDPGVFAYVRNEGLGFEVPYTHAKKEFNYRPDFIVLANDGQRDLLNLVVEIKGYRNGQAQVKADTMEKLWIPAVNNDGRWGRWAFVEIMDPQDFNPDLMQNEPPAKILEKYTGGGRKE